jgi:hypothetical protein
MYICGWYIKMYVSDMDPTKNVYMWMIRQDVCKQHGLYQKRIYVNDTSRCMSATWTPPKTYIYGWYIKMYVSDMDPTKNIYMWMILWWGSCRWHTSWCIIHIYTFLVGSMSLTYILMNHPHIYVFWWGSCRWHTSYICGWYIKMYVSDMEPTKNVYMWMIHQDVCKRHEPHQKRIYVDDTSRCM